MSSNKLLAQNNEQKIIVPERNDPPKELRVSSLEEALQSVSLVSVTKLISHNNSPKRTELEALNSNIIQPALPRKNESNRELTYAEAFQDVVEVCLISFIAICCPPSPSAMIALFGESKNKVGTNPQLSPPDNLNAKSEESQELPPPIPTSILETFWTQILKEYFLSQPDQFVIIQQLLPSISLLTSVNTNCEEESTPAKINPDALMPLILNVKDALIHSKIMDEIDIPNRDSTSSSKAIQVHPSAFGNNIGSNYSLSYILKRRLVSINIQHDTMLSFLQWNDMMLSIIGRTISSVANLENEHMTLVKTSLEARLREDSLSPDQKYAIASMSSHFFRFFSMLLLAIELHVGIGKISEILVAYNRNKDIFIKCMTSPTFIQRRIWLGVYDISSMEGIGPERLLLENGLMYLDACYKLLVLLLQEKKLVVLKKQSSKECNVGSETIEECDPYNLFLKMHSLLELHLKTVYEEIRPSLEVTTSFQQGDHLDLEIHSQIVEGTRFLHKQRYEQIIKEYRERKREREALLLQGKPFARIRPINVESADTLQSKTLPLNKTISSVSPDDIKQTATTTTGDLSNYSNYPETSIAEQFEVNQELMLKIAIGIGRMMHSAAVSLGRNTMDASDASHESYTSLATQMEMNLYKISLTVFELIACFQENHPTLRSFSTDNGSSGATAVVAKTTKFASQDSKTSDVYVQNQLDIADTLSCLAFVQDTRLSSFEDAMLCYKRAVDIYSFFLGNRSEAVEKALHNIAILHVAIAKAMKDASNDTASDESKIRAITAHYEESLQAWKTVLQCQESNERATADISYNTDAHRLEVASTMRYMAKVHDYLNEEDMVVNYLEMGLSSIKQVASELDDDGVELKYAMVSNLVDIYFDREDYAKIVALLSNGELQEKKNVSAHQEKSWYYYVLGESHLQLHNENLALKYLLMYLCAVEALQPRPQLNSVIENIQTIIFCHKDAISFKLNFGSPRAIGSEEYEVLSAAFNVAMLLKNLLQQNLSNLPENLATRNISELIAMFGEIRVEAARQRNFRNDDVTELDNLRLLIADSFSFEGELHFSGGNFNESADIFTEALDCYQELQQAAQSQMDQNASPSLRDAHISPKNKMSSKLSDTLDMNKQKCLLFMGHIYRRMNLYDNSMQCYKAALQIQKRLAAANAVDISESSLDMKKKSPAEGDLMLSDNFDLNIALTDALTGIGLLYADKNHSHSSTRMSQRYLEEASTMKQQLVSSSSISGHHRKNQLLDLVTIYETMLSNTGINQENLISGSTTESASDLSIDHFCQLLFRLGNVYGLLQQYLESSNSYRKCLEILKEKNRQDDLVYGSIMHNYAIVLEKLGGIDNLMIAKNAYETSLIITEKVLGKSHPALGDTLHGIGAIIVSNDLFDQYDIALKYLGRALAIRVASNGNEHIKVSQTMSIIAQIHFRKGEFEQAIRHIEKALQIQRGLYGPDDIRLADSLNILAEARFKRSEDKDYIVAMSCFREVARIRELNNGMKDEATLLTWKRVAGLFAMNGEYGEALTLYEKILPFFRSAMDDSIQVVAMTSCQTDVSQYTVSVLNEMGIIKTRIRRNDEAYAYFKEAFGILEQSTLDDNTKDSEILRTNKNLFITMHGLAVVCDKLGQSEIALSFYTRIVEFCREDFGSECLFVGHIASRIGNIILESFLENSTALGDFKKAEQYLYDALHIFSNEIGFNSNFVGSMHFSLGRAHASMSKLSQEEARNALQHFSHALAILEHQFTTDAQKSSTGLTAQFEIQNEWGFEILKTYDRLQQTKLCLQEILRLTECLERNVITGQETADMQFRLGNIFAKEAKYDDAIHFYERTIDTQRALGSERILDLSNTLHNYGIALYKISQHKLALAAYEESLCIAKSKLGSEHESIAETLYCIGNIYRKTLEIDQAKQYYLETLKIRRNLLGNDDPSLLNPLLNLAKIQANQYEYDAAMTSFKDVLRISKLSFSSATLVVATALHGIANIHANHYKEYDKAAACLETVLGIFHGFYGENHVRIADIAFELGMIYDRLEKFYDARKHCEDALEIYRTLDGEDSLQVAKVLGSIALVHDEMNDHENAIAKFKAALRIYRIHSLEHCAQAGDCYHNLGVVYNRMGMLENALDLYNDALRAYDQSLSGADLKRARTLHAKAVVLAQINCSNEALACFYDALSLMSETPSDDSEGIAETQLWIGKLLVEMGDDDGALAALEAALELKENSSNGNPLKVASILFFQGLIHERRKNYNASASLFKNTLTIQLSYLDEANSEIGETNYHLGCSLQGLREFDEAQRYFDEALYISLSSKPASDFAISNILLHQGQIHYNLFNQNDLAIDCFQRSLELRKKANEKDDILLAETWVSLGRSLEFRGLDLENAIDCYNRAISLYSLQLNGEDVKKEIARTIHHIGTAKFQLHHYDDAFLQFKEALHRKVSCFGEDHAEISLTLHYLGLVFSRQHKNDEARQCLVKAIEIQERLGNNDEESTIRMKRNLAEFYASTGLWDESLSLLKKGVLEPFHLSTSHKQLRLVKDAVKCYDLQLEIITKNVGVSIELADVYIMKGSALGLVRDYRQSVSCFQKALKIQENALDHNHLHLALTLHNLGVAETEIGEVNDAETNLTRSIEIMRAGLKQDSKEVAETICCLGDVMWRQFNYERAIQLYRESATIQRNLFKGDSLNLAQTLSKLGFVFEIVKNYRTAIVLYNECLQIRKSKLGENHHLVATVLFNIGNVQKAQSEYENAIESYKKSLKVRQATRIHSDVITIATTISNIGSAHDALGKKEEATLLYSQALSMYRKVLGSKYIPEVNSDSTHSSQIKEIFDDETRKGILQILRSYCSKTEDAAEIFFNIAKLFEQLSDLKSARIFFNESVALFKIQQPVLSKLRAADALYRLGVIYDIWKSYKEALACFEECIETRSQHLGNTHEDVEALLNVVGDIYEKIGDLDSSLAYMKKALIAKESRDGNPTIDNNTALLHLADSAQRNSDLTRALALYEDALAKQTQEFGRNHIFVGRTLHSIGNVLRESGESEAALKYFKDALQIFRDQVGLESLEFANTAFAMGLLYYDLQLFEESMLMYSQALKIRQVLLGDKHIKVAATYNNMGAVQYEMENYIDAVFFFYKANEIFGPNHEEAGHIFCGLAYAHRQLGQFEEASIYFEKALHAKRETLGMNHNSVGDLLHEYGVFLMEDCDKLLESAKCFEDALKIRELSHGRDSVKVSDTLFHLSKAYHRIGRIGSALSALTESIRINETCLLPDEIGIKSENNDYQGDLLTSYDLLMQLMESGDAPSTVELDLEKADVAYKKGNINMQIKKYPEAISCFDAALIIQTRILGSFHLAVSNTLHNLGSAELKNGDLENAGHHLEESIMVRRKTIDEDDVEIADSLHNLADVFRKRKEFERAIQLFEDSSQIKRACLGAGHLSLANTLYALGSVFADVQSYEKAMRCLMDCLRIRRLKLGEEHLSVSDVLFSIGNIYKARSESDRAIQVYREALKIRRLNMAENTVEIASVLHNMAAALDASKRYEEALHCYESSLHIYETVFGAEDLKVATTLLNMGGLLAEIEDYVDALECYRRCLQIRRKRLGEQDIEVAKVLLSIAMAEEKLNLDEDALRNYEFSLRLFENDNEAKPQEIGKVLYGMAVIYAKQSNYEKALQSAEESVRIRTSSVADIQEDIADALYLIGTLHQLENNVDEALLMFSKCEQVYRRRLGDDHIAVANTLFAIGSIKEKLGARSEAMEAFQESLKIKRDVLGENDLEVGVLYFQLGCLHKSRFEHDVSSSLLQQALRIQSLKLGEECEEVANTQLLLGQVYESLSKWELASESYEKAVHIFQAIDANPIVVAKALGALGGVRVEMNEVVKAIEVFDDAIRLYQQELPQPETPISQSVTTDDNLRQLHLDFADTYFNLGTAYDRKEDIENALQFYRASLEMYVKFIGQDSVDVAKTLNSMGILYAKQCNYVLSTRLLKESLRIRELILGKDSVEVASTLFALGVVHDKIADYTQALEFYSTALKIRQSQLGDKCIEAAETLANIGIVYGNMGQFDKGIKEWEKSLLIYKQCGIGSEDPAVMVVQENMNVAKELAAANVHQGL